MIVQDAETILREVLDPLPLETFYDALDTIVAHALAWERKLAER